MTARQNSLWLRPASVIGWYYPACASHAAVAYGGNSRFSLETDRLCHDPRDCQRLADARRASPIRAPAKSLMPQSEKVCRRSNNARGATAMNFASDRKKLADCARACCAFGKIRTHGSALGREPPIHSLQAGWAAAPVREGGCRRVPRQGADGASRVPR